MSAKGSAGVVVRKPIILENEWNMGIELRCPMAVSNNGYLFTRGQIDVDANTRVLHPNDDISQTRACAGHIRKVLEAADVTPNHVVLVNHYYLADDSTPPDLIEHTLRESLALGSSTPVAMIPVPHFYYPGIRVETDATVDLGSSRSPATGSSFHKDGLYAARSHDGIHVAGRWVCDESLNQVQDVTRLVGDVLADFGEEGATGILWVHIQAPDETIYRECAGKLGTTPDDCRVSTIPCITPESTETALSLSGFLGKGLHRYRDPETGFEALIGERLAILDFASSPSISATPPSSDREELVTQTKSLMPAVENTLRSIGLDFGHVLKATTYYVGGDCEDDLYANLKIRDGYYQHPGPASTGVPFVTLDRNGSRICMSLTLSVIDQYSKTNKETTQGYS